MQVHNKIGAFSFDTPLSVCGQFQDAVSPREASLREGGGPRTSAVEGEREKLPFPVRLIVCVSPLFLLMQKAQKKKLGKKKMPKEHFALCGARQGRCP